MKKSELIQIIREEIKKHNNELNIKENSPRYSSKTRKAMKDKWGLTDDEIDEKEQWNIDIKKGKKTVRDYRNSPLGKKMEKMMKK